ncbi:acetyl-CoA C-acetyltransferase [Micrococcus porci]|uniref:acetyl-CoA C-acetyltransferase n=1 Tax=Micrococcus TaxID=1269 RepID=UPI001CD0075B|nr:MULTISPECIES: acetyl-CoA C-acetyltransferase [Micrococcus]MCG7422672.1 acetyl-CoA C-acetyltransferase [Micrococcus sp. ACRRV]UBH23875.1 acetyl-CoA C-acetyltransferase [Micrococcus porci]
MSTESPRVPAETARPAIAGGELRPAVVVGSNRIPFARAFTAYAEVGEQEMLTAAIDGLVARLGLQGERLGQVSAGAVMKHPKDFNLTREAVMGSALSSETPAADIQVACATGMEAIGTLADKIRLGRIDSAIGGGVDSISASPMTVSESARRVLLQLNSAKTVKDRLKALSSLRPGQLVPEPAAAGEPRTGMSMGEHQALTTHQWGITRQAQDELAAASHRNLGASYASGYQDDLVTPFRGLAKDNNLRPDSTVEKLAGLKPAFGRHLGDEATMTAGNSTPLTDGASAVLLSSEDWAVQRNLPVLAEIVDMENAAVDFVDGEDGLLMSPVYAVPRLLARHGLTLDDLDFVEIHEAFAGTVLATLAAWEDEEFGRTRLGLPGAYGSVDRAKLNVNGSSLAAGHPFAATGGRIVGLLSKMLHEKGEGSLGLVSVCAAGGQGIVALLRGR